MKGLILKDFYMLKSYGKQYLLIFGAMFLYAIMMRSASFSVIYFAIMGSTVVLSSMSMDEAVSFHKFALTMPVSLRTIIQSKYLLFIITTGVGIMGGLLMELSLFLMPFEMDDIFGMEGFASVVTVFVLSNAISMPAMFKLGVEKARYINIGAMMAVGILLVLSVTMGDKTGFSIDRVEEILSGNEFVILCAVISVIALSISYMVTIKLAENKEW